MRTTRPDATSRILSPETRVPIPVAVLGKPPANRWNPVPAGSPRWGDFGAAGDWHAVWAAINELEPERLPGLVLALMMNRGAEVNHARASLAKLSAAPLN
jgi:hypothetical protein